MRSGQTGSLSGDAWSLSQWIDDDIDDIVPHTTWSRPYPRTIMKHAVTAEYHAHGPNLSLFTVTIWTYKPQTTETLRW